MEMPMSRLHQITSLLLALAFSASGQAHASEKAVVAGGCFWCVEKDFEGVPGVLDVVSGYTGGSLENPTYENHEGHYEAVEITFDPAKLSYDKVINLFLRSVDVTDPNGQFCDQGSAYRTAIFAQNADQTAIAKAEVEAAAAALGQKIVTPVLAAKTFWLAEDYHQDYYKSSAIILTRAGPKTKKSAYTFYRNACGRDQRVKELWGDAAAFAK
jgi:peptide-methionine (S)-S-oxide reductase